MKLYAKSVALLGGSKSMSSMKAKKEQLNPKPLNPRDLYFECITACSIDDEDIECLTECVTNYYEDVVVE